MSGAEFQGTLDEFDFPQPPGCLPRRERRVGLRFPSATASAVESMVTRRDQEILTES